MRSIRRRVSRQAWGAGAPDCRTLILPFTAEGFGLHYSGALADKRPDHSECAGVCRAFQAHHMGPDGLGVPDGGCDIAYSHLICPHGFTFVGRGFWARTGANGTGEANRRFPLAVCIIGGDREGRQDVTGEARESLRVYRRRVLTVHPTARKVRPHSSFVGTGCPGDELRRLAATWWPAAVR